MSKMIEETSTRIPTKRGRRLHVFVNNQPVEAYAGETAAAVLITSGHRNLGPPEQSAIPGSLFCGMGVCYSCLVTIDGVPNIRACVTPVAEGMTIMTGRPPHE
jgi:sarcosine oxidase subunit alpha